MPRLVSSRLISARVLLVLLLLAWAVFFVLLSETLHSPITIGLREHPTLRSCGADPHRILYYTVATDDVADRPLDIRRPPSLPAANRVSVPSLDIVIAFYRAAPSTHWQWEEIAYTDYVQRNRPRWYVYNKGSTTYPFHWLRDFPHDSVEVRASPNVGKEGHTYLHFITQHYDALAAHTLFCQENPMHGHQTLRMDFLLSARTGFLSLGPERWCDVSETTEAGCYASGNPQLCAFYRWATESNTCPQDFVFASTACFIVSRRRVLSRPLAFYQKWLELLSAPGHHPIFNRAPFALSDNVTLTTPLWYKRGTQRWDTVNPYLGHILERLWAPMFGCHLDNVSMPDAAALPAALHVLLRGEADAKTLPLHCLDP